jgi:hypothetical protein
MHIDAKRPATRTKKQKKACGVPAGSAVDAAVGDPRAARQRFKEAFE